MTTTTVAERPSDRVSAEADLSLVARKALAASFLGELPAPLVRHVTRDARERTYPVGPLSGRAGSNATPPLGLVLAGRIRFSLLSPNGRELALLYAGPGSMIGITSLAYSDGAARRPLVIDGHPFVPATCAEAMQPLHMLVLSTSRVLQTAQRDPALAWALAKEIARQAGTMQELVATNVFTPIRSRVARHLLNLAVRDGSRLVVTASQQEIADTIGSVREVVSRTVSAFVSDGLIVRDGKRLVVQEARRLAQLAQG